MTAESLESTEHEGAARSDAVPSPVSGAAPNGATHDAPAAGHTSAFAGGAGELGAPGACPPAEWLDDLALAVASLAPDTPTRAVATALLAVAARNLAGVAVGGCIADLDGDQLVVRLFDAGADDVPPSPARLFPDHPVERALRVPQHEGSTLHLASHDPGLLAPGSVALSFAERLARSLGAALRHARAHESATARAAERRALEAQLVHQAKLASLGQMAASIVHELNNPLTSIIAYADYLRTKNERNGADAADVERLRRIGEAAERIQRFARDLVTFSRPGSTTPTLLPIHEVIDRALLFCEHVLDQTGVRVERSFGHLPRVRGVADQLTQVFVNLFTNAAHAMRDGGGGLLRITTAPSGAREIAITIADDGHGVDAAHLPHIFDPFFTTKTDGSGTGLGLSIVRNIVVAHGGRIRAAGLEPRGMAFHLQLPAAADDEG